MDWAAWLLVVDFAASKLVLKIFIYAPLGGRAIIIRIECVSGAEKRRRRVLVPTKVEVVVAKTC